MSPAPERRTNGEMPEGEAALVALVAEAAARGEPLLTEGSGTKRHLGPEAPGGVRRISLRRLAAITSYEPGDMVVCVQTGIRLVDLQRTLGEHGQWLPVDPPFAEATLGGILATGSAGPRRLGYGPIKDHVLGMRVVGAGGTVTKSGGRVVKNVTGFDLHKLQVGAFGSLGVLLEVNLKVTPRPEVSGVLALGCPGLEAALALLLAISTSPLRPVALEALDRGAAETLRARAPGLPAGEALALVGLEGSRPVFARHLRDLAAQRAAAADEALLEGPAAEALWAALRDEGGPRGTEVTVRLGAKPHDLPGLLADLAPAVTGATSVRAQAGVGTARVALPAARLVARARGGARRLRRRRGGAARDARAQLPPLLDRRRRPRPGSQGRLGSEEPAQPREDGPLKLPVVNGAEAPSFEKVSTCVHCGLCLEACPTYRELRVEMDSPRGRIYLMKGLLQGKLEPTPTVLKHLDQCLDCRACETACPSGVEYAHILEKTRTVLQPQRKLSWGQRLVRWFVFALLLPSRAVQRVVFKLLWLQQALGLTRLGAWLGRRGLLPGRLSAAAAQAPAVPFRSFRERHAAAFDPARGLFAFPARGERKRRVALFTGCLADQLFADVNEATVRVLTENGCDVEVLEQERCCGALHIHNGAREEAKGLARANVEAFGRDYDAIVSNAAGCSAELRHYGALLGEDAHATAFGHRVRDVSEYLAEIGWKTPSRPGPLTGTLAYDEPCHLLHAQRISDPPKRLLRSIPGITLVPLDEADACCGSAGVYSVLQPALSSQISGRKIDAIARSGAAIVATGNPGCLMQIRGGVKAAGLPVRVVHPVELLAAAYEASAADASGAPPQREAPRAAG
jgi:glycolate oxidase iron-sulfur subunit